LDRIFCVCRLSNGSMRRLDIIVVPYIEWPFALLSWTGSKVCVCVLILNTTCIHTLSLSLACSWICHLFSCKYDMISLSNILSIYFPKLNIIVFFIISQVFNRMIRYFANTKGLSLSAHGILTVPRTHAQFNNNSNNNTNTTSSSKEKSFRISSPLTSTCAASEENNDNMISCMKSDYLDTVTTTVSLEPLLVPYQTSPNSFKQPITEKDVFDILGLPYIPPHLRNA
jgi:hypothetical protein